MELFVNSFQKLGLPRIILAISFYEQDLRKQEGAVEGNVELLSPII